MHIASREFVIKKLTELMTNPKKKYSQNFLTDYEVVQMAVSSLNKECVDVIEIGPGLGAISEEVLNQNFHLYAYEIDEVMVNHLSSYFERNRNFTLIAGDFLKQKLSFENKVNVISNLPYNLTTPIIERILSEKINVDTFTFMVQKEVYDRLKAKINTKDYSPLSIMMNYLGTLSVVCKVNKDKFIPSPNVDSIILSLKFKNERNFDLEKRLFSLLNASFAMRRKTILNNLINYYHDKDKALKVLNDANIAINKRPEQLSVEDYLTILKCE